MTDVKAKLAQLERKRTILTAFGGLGTFGYLCLLALLTDWQKLLGMEPNNVGDFLAGAFAPLAFLWLVIGYFLQALELKQNSESLMQQAAEMKSAVEQASLQAKAASANEVYARLSLVNATRERYEDSLGKLAGKLYGLRTGHEYRETAIGFEQVSVDATFPLWQRFASGDKEVFADLVWGDLSAASEAQSYRERLTEPEFERLTNSYLTMFCEFTGILNDLGDSRLVKYYEEDTAYGQLASTIRHLDVIEALERDPHADF